MDGESSVSMDHGRALAFTDAEVETQPERMQLALLGAPKGVDGGERNTRGHGGFFLPKRDVEEIFAALDQNGDGSITQAEMIRGLKQHPWAASKLGMPSHIRQEDQTRNRYQLAFGSMDSDESKTIELDELLAYCGHGRRGEPAAPSSRHTQQRVEGGGQHPDSVSNALREAQYKLADMQEELEGKTHEAQSAGAELELLQVWASAFCTTACPHRDTHVLPTEEEQSKPTFVPPTAPHVFCPKIAKIAPTPASAAPLLLLARVSRAMWPRSGPALAC